MHIYIYIYICIYIYTHTCFWLKTVRMRAMDFLTTCAGVFMVMILYIMCVAIIVIIYGYCDYSTCVYGLLRL